MKEAYQIMYRILSTVPARYSLFALLLWLLLPVVVVNTAQAQTPPTAFTYQGRLTDAGAPANGTYDLQFTLYDNGGAPVGSPVVREDVAVANGIFTVQLDFGTNVFTSGQASSLEIGVRAGTSTGAFTVLSPRQPITASPYAVQTLNATQLGGVAATSYVQTGGGSGTTDTIPVWTGGGTLGNSVITQSAAGVQLPNGVQLGVGAQGNQVRFGSPNGETGMSIQGASGRADLRFDGTLKLVAGAGGVGPPPATNGIAISTSGRVGIGSTNFNLDAKLQVITSGLTGIYSSSQGGFGVSAVSDSSIGVYGTSTSDNGVRGASSSGDGVLGSSETGSGVRGESFNGNFFSGSTPTGLISFRVRNDGQVRSNVGFTTPAADFAEMLPAEANLAAGDVLVIGRGGKLARSTRPRQTSVAGVFSTKPGFVGGQGINSEQLNNIPLAVVGIVPVKVTAENGRVRVGDLLTTSGTPGYAMRCANRLQCVGATIGKAMEPLQGSKGVIKMLVTLR